MKFNLLVQHVMASLLGTSEKLSGYEIRVPIAIGLGSIAGALSRYYSCRHIV